MQEVGRVHQVCNAVRRQSLIRQQWWIQRKLMQLPLRINVNMQVCVAMAAGDSVSLSPFPPLSAHPRRSPMVTAVSEILANACACAVPHHQTGSIPCCRCGSMKHLTSNIACSKQHDNSAYRGGKDETSPKKDATTSPRKEPTTSPRTARQGSIASSGKENGGSSGSSSARTSASVSASAGASASAGVSASSGSGSGSGGGGGTSSFGLAVMRQLSALQQSNAVSRRTSFGTATDYGTDSESDGSVRAEICKPKADLTQFPHLRGALQRCHDVWYVCVLLNVSAGLCPRL